MIRQPTVVTALDLINQTLLPHARGLFRLNGMDESGSHGVPHWYSVWVNFLTLATIHPKQVDVHAGALFCMLHDCQRLHDGDDPWHAQRAADHLISIWNTLMLPGNRSLQRVFTDGTLSSAVVAIRHHNLGGTLAQDPTVACCWDADRLDLTRYHLDINPDLLSTEAARESLIDPEAWEALRAHTIQTHDLGCVLDDRPVESDTGALGGAYA